MEITPLKDITVKYGQHRLLSAKWPLMALAGYRGGRDEMQGRAEQHPRVVLLGIE